MLQYFNSMYFWNISNTANINWNVTVFQQYVLLKYQQYS
jgi:hypothetical protein